MASESLLPFPGFMVSCSNLEFCSRGFVVRPRFAGRDVAGCVNAVRIRSTWWGRWTSSIEAARRQLILIPTKIMSQLVQVRHPNFFTEGFDVAVGEFPETREIEEDLGRHRTVERELG